MVPVEEKKQEDTFLAMFVVDTAMRQSKSLSPGVLAAFEKLDPEFQAPAYREPFVLLGYDGKFKSWTGSVGEELSVRQPDDLSQGAVVKSMQLGVKNEPPAVKSEPA